MAKQNASVPNLFVALHEQAALLLNDAEIYSVLDYAWEDEDTPATDHLGLAIWSTDAPFEPSWFPWERSSPPPMPTERDETFYKAGEDFIGTMELARNAIGLALYSFEHRKPDNIMDDDVYFWEQSASAAVWLNIAADRIREYHVMARFGITAEQYDTQFRRAGFLRPFRAYEPDATRKAKEAAADLLKDAKELESRRSARNEIVHEVASRQGRNAVVMLKHQKEASSQTSQVSVSNATIEEVRSWKDASEAIHAQRRKEMEDTISDLKAWYLLAVHACALAFEYEYWKRIGK